MLYPSTPISRPRANIWDERSPALPSVTHNFATVHNSTLGSSRRHTLHYAANVYQQQQQQQQLTINGSSAQVPRVTKSITQSTGFPLSTSHRFSPSSQKRLAQRLYAASVPSNSPHSNRPPVPLFNSAGNPQSSHQGQPAQHRRVMSTSNLGQDLSVDPFDIHTNYFKDEFESPNESTMFHYSFTNTDSPAVLPTGTISPKDLLMDASAPPSTSVTDLSSPSLDSPAMFSNDTSPMIPSDHELPPGYENWDSLFPSVSDDVSAVLAALPKTAASASPMIRSASSPGMSPDPSGRNVNKHSSVAGVNARRREKPLPPITYDTSDPVAVKRARNTEAARKSRARKLERNDAMERRISDLEKQLEEARRNEEYWKSVAEGALAAQQ